MSLFSSCCGRFRLSIGRVVACGLLTTTGLGAGPDPTLFSGRDIGSPILAGSTTTATDGTTVIVAGGQGIGLKSDQFHYAATNWEGDFDVKFRVAALGAADLWSKAGLMVRRDEAPGSPFAAVFTTPSGAGALYQSRATDGGTAVNVGFFPSNLPLGWLRLKRSGDAFTGYAGYDGQHWSPLGTSSVSLGTNALLGYAVTSHQTNQTTRAEMVNFADASNDSVVNLATGREPIGPTTRRTALAFSEIMYHPADRTDGRELEFIELYNSQPFYEDISGFQIAGVTGYTFPAKTIIPGGGFLVVAVNPADVKAVYGLPTVLGPLSHKLPGKSGQLQLLNEQGAVYLDLVYRADGAWPKSADGGGHSLVLARPSYGEASSEAWAASRVKGGSPGMPDAVGISPLSRVRINEWTLTAGAASYVELYNGSTNRVELAGARLTLDPALPGYALPIGTRLEAGGFLRVPWASAGLAPIIKGAALFLESPDQTSILDAVDLTLNRPGQSVGRWPDGGVEIRPLSEVTPEAPNVRPMAELVINEIHFAPLNGDSREEFIELFNPGTLAVDLGGWKFTEGVNFTFPLATSLAPGAYLVVVSDSTYFRTLHPDLSATSIVGDFLGKLSSRGERLALSQPLTVPGAKPGKTDIVFAEVTSANFTGGGRWSHSANGGGSTLELIDPRSDPNLPANWGDSDESSKAGWTLVQTTGTLELGAGVADSLHVLLLGAGEALIDNVEVIGPSKTNIISNGTFETGLTNWVAQGNHIASTLESSEGYQSGHSLHLRASGNGDTSANRIRTRLTRALKDGDKVTIRARVRWLRGWPEILFRIKGNYLESFGRLKVPATAGTPGAPNSRKVPNAGPAFAGVTHFPAVPAAGEPVVVTARIDDPDNVAMAQLYYRVDPGTNRVSVPLRDDGLEGDLLAGDGIYSAIIPGQDTGKLVAFSLVAIDGAATAATSVFPPGAPAHECLVRFGDPTPSGAFGTYRLWLTQSALKTWSSRPNLSNEAVDSAFVYGNWRVIYGAGGRYAGSPYHQQFSSPTGQCHYVIDVPDDDRVLGASAFNKIHAPGNGPFDDSTIQREQAAYWLARRSGLPWLYRRYVNVIVNGSKRSTLMEDTQVGSSDFVKSWWSTDSDGDLFKMQPWFEFDDGTGNSFGFQNNSWCYLQNYQGADGKRKMERFRWNWLPRGVNGSANNYTNVFKLVDVATATGDVDYVAKLQGLVDTDNWLKTFAIHHALGNWDSVGYNNQQNTYAYKPPHGPWRLVMWDSNIVFGNSGSHGPSGLPLTSTSDSVIANWYSSTPVLARRYRQALLDLINGPFSLDQLSPVLDAKYQAFQEHGVNASSPSVIKSYLTTARRDILKQITNGVPNFEVLSSSGLAFDQSPAELTMIGFAPLEVAAFTLNGVRIEPQWTDQNTWLITTALPTGVSHLVLVGLDRSGQIVSGVRDERTIQLVHPKEHVAFSEIMYQPAVARGEYVELVNTSTNTPIPIGGWRIEELNYTFNAGLIFGPRTTLVVARDLQVFQNTYTTRFVDLLGPTTRGLSPRGQTVRLTRPIPESTDRELITAVTYSAQPPWPVLPTKGVALQLRDVSGSDDERVGNWGFNPPTAPDTNVWRRLTVTGPVTGTNLILRLSSWPPILDLHDLSGRWTMGNSGEFASVLRLDRGPDGTARVNLASSALDEGIFMEQVSFVNGAVRFKYPGFDYRFSGKLSPAGDRLSGSYGASGNPNPPVTYRRQNPGGSVLVDEVQLVAGSEPNIGPNLLADGGFEGDFSADWLAAGTYSSSGPVATTPLAGSRALRLNSSVGGDGTTNAAVFQSLPGLIASNIYSLTVWYHLSTNAEAMVVGFDDHSLQVAVDVRPQPLPHPEYSPGLPSSLVPLLAPLPPIFLNEIQPHPPGWVELYNASEATISLNGFFLVVGPGIDSTNRWAFPADASLTAQGFLVVGLGAEPPRPGLQAHLSWPTNVGQIALVRAIGGAFDLVDVLKFEDVPAGGSFGHGHDASAWEDRVIAVATPGQGNRVARLAASPRIDVRTPLHLNWNTDAGRSYRLERSASLLSAKWEPVTTRRATGDDDFYDDTAPTEETRFYRLVPLP